MNRTNYKTSFSFLQPLSEKIRIHQIKIEMFAIFLIVLGMIFRDTKTGAYLLIFSMGSLSIIYYLQAFRLQNSANRMLVFLNKLVNWSFAIGMLGILFAINRYPNAEVMIIVSLGSIFFGLIGLLILKLKKSQDDLMADIIRGIVIAIVLALLMAFADLPAMSPSHQ